MNHITPVVKKLLLLNVTIFFVQNLLRLDLIDSLGLRYIFSECFRPYQFFTHLFIHVNLGHLFSNMFAVLTFGPALERTLNSKTFIAFYIMTGLGAAVLYAGIQYIEIGKLEALYRAYLVLSLIHI